MKKTLLFLLLALSLAGCATNDMTDDGLTTGDKQLANRIDQIAKQSDGDWEKVSQADRDYLVKEVSMGSVESAKMLLLGKAGKLKATPGGPPAGP